MNPTRRDSLWHRLRGCWPPFGDLLGSRFVDHQGHGLWRCRVCLKSWWL